MEKNKQYKHIQVCYIHNRFFFLKKMRIFVFDTETTGLPKTKLLDSNTTHLWPSIVQLSYISYDTDRHIILQSTNNIIHLTDDVHLPLEATRIHGITQDMCDKSTVTIRDALRDFVQQVQKADLVVCHNIEFDINMIRAEILRIQNRSTYDDNKKDDRDENDENDTTYSTMWEQLGFREERLYCTMKHSVTLCNLVTVSNFGGKTYLKFPRLIELFRVLFPTEPEPTHLHNAFVDVLVTLRCYMMLRYNEDICDSSCGFRRTWRTPM